MLQKSTDRQSKKMKIAVVTLIMLIGIIAISCTVLLWRRNMSYERSSESYRYPLPLTIISMVDGKNLRIVTIQVEIFFCYFLLDTMLMTSKWSSTFTPSKFSIDNRIEV